MIIWIIRTFLLLSMIAIAFLFTRSQQFGTLESKVVSLDFSPDSQQIAVAMNHALWNYDDEYKKRLSHFSRRISAINLETNNVTIVHEAPIPITAEIDYVEWLRILGQRPNYESQLLPFSPIQFVASTNRLAYYNFETNAVKTFDLDSGTHQLLIRLKQPPGQQKLTEGWFIVPPDGRSIIVESTDMNLHRYSLNTESLEVKLPLGEPFYVDSQNLSLGSFIDLRLLGNRIQEPTPIFGASRNPNEQELAVTTVLQICFIKFDGRIPRRLLSRRLEIGSTILYSPDGQLMAAVHRDTIRFFSVEKSKTEKVINNGERLITAFAFSPDSKLFATGDNYGRIRIWDAKTFELLAIHTLDLDWRVHWLVPYAAGLAWVLVFIATLRPRKKKSLDSKIEEAGESVPDSHQPGPGSATTT